MKRWAIFILVNVYAQDFNKNVQTISFYIFDQQMHLKNILYDM